MNRTEKIQALENRLKFLTGTSLTDQLIEDELVKAREDISKRVRSKSIESLRDEFTTFRDSISFDPVFEAITKADTENKTSVKTLEQKFAKQLTTLVQEFKKSTRNNRDNSDSSVKALVSQINSLRASFQNELQSFTVRDNLLAAEIDRVSQEMRRIGLIISDTTDQELTAQSIEEVRASVLELGRTLNNRIANIQQGGGNANRNIAVGGNSSVLSKYTDINLKAGSNMTITAVANTTTKQTDITFTSTGGGGSFLTPTGTVNGINTIFVVASEPTMVIADGMGRVAGFGYTYAAPNITFDIAPQDWVRYM